jgi:hypothetical protein
MLKTIEVTFTFINSNHITVFRRLHKSKRFCRQVQNNLISAPRSFTLSSPHEMVLQLRFPLILRLSLNRNKTKQQQQQNYQHQ